MNDDLREDAIRDLFPLVKRIARRIRAMVPGTDVNDLVGDGCIGLIRAVDHFDPTRGPTLEMYARRLIVGTMLNGIRRMDPVSERARRAVRDGENARYANAVAVGRMPSVAEMQALAPGFARARVAAEHGTPLSLDAPLPDGESLKVDHSGDPGTLVAERLENAYLHDLVDALPTRQRDLIYAHYFGERSLRQVSAAMNISPQRASQLHLAAMAKLRKATRARAR